MPRPSVARWKWPSRPPLWPTKATPPFDAALRLARVQHVQHHAVDIVGDAEAIGADHGKPGRPRGLCRRRPASSWSPTSAKPAANTIAEPTLRRAQASMASRTPAAGSVNTARSTPSGSSSGLFSTGRPSIGSSLRPTRWISPWKLLTLRALQDDLAGAACARRHSDDRDRPRPQELATAFGPRAACGPVISRPCRAGTSKDACHQQADASTASPSCRPSVHRPCSSRCWRRN